MLNCFKLVFESQFLAKDDFMHFRLWDRGRVSESKDLMERLNFQRITTSLGAFGGPSPKLAAWYSFSAWLVFQARGIQIFKCGGRITHWSKPFMKGSDPIWGDSLWQCSLDEFSSSSADHGQKVAAGTDPFFSSLGKHPPVLWQERSSSLRPCLKR